MKAPRLNTLTTKLLGIFTLIAVISFSSCAKKVNFLSSSIVPAARGQVKVKRDKNKNYVIQIHLLNLAESKRLQPSKETYIVWMLTGQDITQNLGQVNTSTGIFSRKLKTSFKAVTPLKPDKIFITAEDDKSIQFPRGEVILSTDRFWR
jgi:hypothetical protein